MTPAPSQPSERKPSHEFQCTWPRRTENAKSFATNCGGSAQRITALNDRETGPQESPATSAVSGFVLDALVILIERVARDA
jgi:hypothetical protein